MMATLRIWDYRRASLVMKSRGLVDCPTRHPDEIQAVAGEPSKALY